MRTLQALLHDAQRGLHRSRAGGATDGQLLNRFRNAGDESAFELLVWRHGPMVLSACRRILADEHAAEDAFQATFLMLARKAGSIGRGQAVAAWLYRVAYRIALRAKMRDARRVRRERIAGEPRAARTSPDPGWSLEWEELRPHLDAEIARLPEEYRSAFILCHLEGKTNEEAARELGCPVGTIQSRLSRARVRLRARLRNQDLGPESILFIFFIQRPQAPADLPPALANAVLRAALPLTPARAAVPRSKPNAIFRASRNLRRAAVVLIVLLFLALASALAYAGLTAPTPSGAAPDSSSASAGGCH
jgi:RNA polymerase sigma factor (sigma-70 family)